MSGWNIRAKLGVVSGALGVFLIISLLLFLFTIGEMFIKPLLNSNLSQIKDDIYTTVQSSYRMTLENVKHNLKTAAYFIEGSTANDYSVPVEWMAIDQITRISNKVTMPGFKVNGKVMLKDHSLVDSITEMVGGTVTIFQIMTNGLLRVSTSVKNLDGSRAISTFIPTDSPVYKTVIKGETFYGKAFVVNDWYVTAYKPLYHPTQGLIGVLYVGIRQEILKSIFKDFAFGDDKSGYAYILDAKGKVFAHQKDEMVGKDWSKEPFFPEMMEKKEGTISYYSEITKSKNIVQYHWFAEMEWLICSEMSEKDYYMIYNNLLIGGLISVLIVCVILVLIALVFSGKIVRSIGSLSGTVKGMVDRGTIDMTRRFEYKSGDEIGKIVTDINVMINDLEQLIGMWKVSGINLVNVTTKMNTVIEDDVRTEIESIKKKISVIEGNLNDEMSSVEEVNATVEEMSRSTDAILLNIQRQASAVEQTASSIEQMNRTIEHVQGIALDAKGVSVNLNAVADEGVNSVEKGILSIREVSEYSQQILKMLHLITDISKQTNLLAMNASIEAAHAGESGKGFAIVADEIRRLAESTGKSAREIGEVVNTILEKINEAVELSERAGTGLESILMFSTRNLKSINSLETSMKEQVDSAKEILTTTQELVHTTEDIRVSMEEQKQGTDEFKLSMLNLKDNFNTSRDNIGEHIECLERLILDMGKLKDLSEQGKTMGEHLNSMITNFKVTETEENHEVEPITSIKLVD
ncbi:MAG: hypothetical protein A2Y33_09045 [Spirochaetes bacterium GWF1_51_8]|nr:MAG: hypothetical protein A2Y33_09045 [Spirochaetes bacterium GWF1_51_8]